MCLLAVKAVKGESSKRAVKAVKGVTVKGVRVKLSY